MKHTIFISRVLLASTLLFFGLNGFLEFYPLPETTPQSKAFQDALWESGYVMYIVKVLEVAVGTCLLLNRFVTAAAFIYLPVAINVMLVDVLLQPEFWYVGTSVFALNLILLTPSRQIFVSLFALPVTNKDISG